MAIQNATPLISICISAAAAAAPIFEVIDRVRIRRLFPLQRTTTNRPLHQVPLIDSQEAEGRELQEVRGEIRVENVDFRYPTRPEAQILRNVSIDVKVREAWYTWGVAEVFLVFCFFQ